MKRKVKKFRKEYDELVNEFLRKMNHHYTRLMCNFLNDGAELHKKLNESESSESGRNKSQ